MRAGFRPVVGMAEVIGCRMHSVCLVGFSEQSRSCIRTNGSQDCVHVKETNQKKTAKLTDNYHLL